MLETLRISGLSLLKDCELELPPGLTVVSGETGAGKTVLLTSLRLLTGGRADPSMVAVQSGRTEIDSVAIVDPQISAVLEEAGFSVDEGETTFSRTVPVDGRSKGAISGRPVPVKMLAETLGQTITIHGQADQWRLKGSSAQRALLDGYAGPEHGALLERYQDTWNQTVQLRSRFKSLTSSRDQQQIELQYLREMVTAIDALDLVDDEEEVIDSAIDRLTNVQDLRDEVGLAVSMFDSERSMGPSDLLGRVAEALRRAERQDPSLADLEQRASQLEVESSSLESDLRDYVESLMDDPEELARLHDRRARLTELMRGRATRVPELLTWAENARGRIAELEDESSDPESVAKQLKNCEAELATLARSLRDSRGAAAKRLSAAVNRELSDLALANAQFSVAMEDQPLTQNGGEKITMMLRPHPSAEPAPISQGASGGELSRIMLALEVSLAEDDSGKTFVFDEIDAGIGGTTVGAVAARLRELGRHQQVIVVTHQPQIAVVADANFVVTKVDGVAEVAQVTGERRTDEIVRMLGGDTEAARRHALDLEARARATINE